MTAARMGSYDDLFGPADPEVPHVHPFPGNQLVHVPYMGGEDSSDPNHADTEQRTVVTDLDLAVVVSSQVDLDDWQPLTVGDEWVVTAAAGRNETVHRPVIDLDIDARLVPSSTEGHSHLYLDTAMTWSQYSELLDALATAHVIERGYAEAAKRRGASHVRVPWLRKGDKHPQLPLTLVQQITQCRDREQVAALYADHLDEWGDEHNEAARATAKLWGLRAALTVPPLSTYPWGSNRPADDDAVPA